MLYPELSDLLSYKAKIKRLELTGAKSYELASGANKSIFKGQGLEFDGVRNYLYGDDVRYIDWKVTARTGTPHVKTFQKESLCNITLVIDCNDYMCFGTQNTFKSVQAANVAAVLGFTALAHNDKVGGLLFGNLLKEHEFFKPGDHKVLHKLLARLCYKFETQNTTRHNISDAIEKSVNYNKNSNLIFIISDFLNIDHKFTKKLYQLTKTAEVVLVSINDPSDYIIPEIGEITFKNNKAEFVVNSDDKLAIMNYQKMWLDNRELLNMACKISHAKQINLLTLDDPLISIYQQLVRK